MGNKKVTEQPTIKSADDLIVKAEAEKLGKVMPPKAQSTPEKTESPPLETKAETEKDQMSAEAEPPKAVEEETLEAQTQTNEVEASQPSVDDDVDEYGTKIGKPKLYTEEEVQRMIRERLSRGKHAETEVQQAAKDFKPDPNSQDDWQTQLKQFIDTHLEEKTKKVQEAEWRQREEQSQAEFEVKFSQGISKYDDFNKVVAGKPITGAMMLATRSMKDPAAFIYAASKQHAGELSRIAQIPDAVTQAVEIGRLEEKMRKTKNLPSSPTPPKKISGDSSREMPQLDIDARIAQHAKTKIMR